MILKKNKMKRFKLFKRYIIICKECERSFYEDSDVGCPRCFKYNSIKQNIFDKLFDYLITSYQTFYYKYKTVAPIKIKKFKIIRKNITIDNSEPHEIYIRQYSRWIPIYKMPFKKRIFNKLVNYLGCFYFPYDEKPTLKRYFENRKYLQETKNLKIQYKKYNNTYENL